jgi:hypothetical protein
LLSLSVRVFPSIPPGALAANLIGGYIIGVAVAFFAAGESVAYSYRRRQPVDQYRRKWAADKTAIQL